MVFENSTYNITGLTSAETVADIVVFANESTGNFLFGLFILAIFFIMLMVMRKYEFTDTLLTSSFVCFILSAILSYGGFLNILFPIGFLTVLSFTAFYVFMNRN